MKLTVSTKLRRTLTAVLAATAVAGALAVTGCANDTLAQQYRAGSGKNYIAGDGSVTEIAVANRTAPITYSGTDLDGKTVSSSQFAGKVQVINFWYAGCAPCRAEAKDLETIYKSYTGKNVVFLGVNVRDSAATASAFVQNFGLTYNSLTDPDGKVQLAFSSSIPPNAVPTTIILDEKGRVAARILGRLEAQTILTTLIDDQLKAGS